MEKKPNRVPWIIGGFVVGAIVIISISLFFAITKSTFPIWRVIWISAVTLAVLAGIGFILYFIINRNTEKDRPLEQIKEFVSAQRAIEIVHEEVMKENNIEYRFTDTKPVKIEPLNRSDIKLGNAMTFPDPGNQTSDIFSAFEIVCRAGEIRGTLLVVVRRDYGEDYIRHNWRENTKWHEVISTFKRDFRKFPLTSTKSFSERIALKGAELIDQGYTPDEIKIITSPYNLNQSSPQPAAPVPAISGPTIGDAYPQYAASQDEEEDVDVADIESDLKRTGDEWRRKAGSDS